jgi:hypothetical protein
VRFLTAIGLFPDVGSSAWLPHLANGFGAAIGELSAHSQFLD